MSSQGLSQIDIAQLPQINDVDVHLQLSSKNSEGASFRQKIVLGKCKLPIPIMNFCSTSSNNLASMWNQQNQAVHAPSPNHMQIQQ